MSPVQCRSSVYLALIAFGTCLLSVPLSAQTVVKAELGLPFTTKCELADSPARHGSFVFDLTTKQDKLDVRGANSATNIRATAVDDHLPPPGLRPFSGLEPRLGIVVRVFNYADVSHRTLVRTEAETSRIFREAGVELTWLDCPTSHADEEKYPACAPPLGAMALDVKILSAPMVVRVKSSKDEVGAALQCGEGPSIAWVYYPQLELLAEGEVASVDQIMGDVITHELGHLLLGPDSHSHGGLMRCNWDVKYLEEATRGQLLFTPDQVRLIRADVKRRWALASGATR